MRGVGPQINNNISFIDYRAIYSQEIANLKNELNIKNQTIEQQKSQIIYLQNQIINLNNFKQLDNNNQIVINNLKNDLKMKENELIVLRNQLQSILNQKSNQMRFSSSAVATSRARRSLRITREARKAKRSSSPRCLASKPGRCPRRGTLRDSRR